MTSRRNFLKHMSVGAALWRLEKLTSPSSWILFQVPPLTGKDVTGRPAWLREGIVCSSYMEPLEFYIRRGGAPTDVAQRWKEDFNDDIMKQYRDTGINLVIMPLHKGMGLKAEAESIDATRRFTEIAHRYGIKVGGYVGSTMVYETFYDEEPEARKWEQIDERGRPMYYGDQTFRHAACRNNPGYRAFIQKVLRLGIQDLKLDLVHFDQLQWWPEPWSCHCDYCQEAFRAFLRNKFSDKQLKARLGLLDIKGIRVPDFNLDVPPVVTPWQLKDPLRQEWELFRCASLAEWWKATHEYIRTLNSEVALLGNPTMVPASNGGFIYGMDIAQMLLHSDYLWTEEPNQPRWTSDECLVSLIRSYKSVRSMGKSLFITQGLHMEGPPKLRLAEAIAYNDLNMGVVAGGWEFGSNRLSPDTQQYVRFFRSHLKDLSDTAPVTDVAILRSFASIQFNPTQSNVSTILFEQTLIQCKLPFGIIFDRHLMDLHNYKVLVLANQDALSDSQVDRIRRFVDDGGGLVATEQTSMLTEWRMSRDKLGLADVLGIDVPPDPEKQTTVRRKEFGRGRVVYIRQVEPSVAPPPPAMSYYFTNKYWNLPKNHQELVEAVRWAGRDEFSCRVDAPLWVTSELAEQRNTGTWLLHLLNFKTEEPIADIPVQIRLPKERRLREAVLDSPDRVPRQVLRITSHANGVSFVVPKLETYDLVVLHIENI